MRNRPAVAALLPLLVLLSGAAGLIYEVLWIRALGRSFGTTVPAISTVLAAFMGGMALGNLVFGPIADRSTRPFRLYRRVEFGIAVSACGVSLLLLRADSLLSWLARVTETSGALAGAVRFAVFAVLIAGPSTLVGGTLVVLARALVSRGHSGRTVGVLYAINTAGAVLGALAPDLALIPAIGMTGAALTAGAANLAVALLAGVFDVSEVPARPELRSAAPKHTGPALALYGVSGFCAMAAEVLWSRTLSHWSAALVTSFAVLLAVFLAALALGSFATRRLADRVQRPLHWAAACVGLTGLAVLAPLSLAGRWRDLQRQWLPLGDELRPSVARETLGALMHALYLQGPACLLMGAALPFLAAAIVREQGAGRQTARLYAVNTLAGVAGSLAAGFLWLPQLGELDSFLATATLSTLGAAAVALRLEASAARRVALACLPAALAAAWLLPGDLLHRAHFRSDGHVLAVREGTTTTAGVAQHYEFGFPAYRELLTPGVSMSDTSFGARRYMALMGHLGVLFSEQAERALLICYGAGNTARALLSHPTLKLDVVDIAEEVFELSPYFGPDDPLKDPRTRAFVDDGRHHLLARDADYDVITSEPPPPNHAGVVNLYTREYYRIARARLRPGGVLTQWLPVFQLSPVEIATMAAAFTAEFRHTALFYGYGHEWILVGSDAPLRVDHARWLRRTGQPEVARDLAAVGVDSVFDLYAGWLLSDAELRAMATGAEPLADDRPTIQYPSAGVRTHFHLERTERRPRVLAALTTPPTAEDAQRIAQAAQVQDRVVASLEKLTTRPVELLELEFVLPLAALMPMPGGGEAVLALAGLDAGTAQRARGLLQNHPDPLALLGPAATDPEVAAKAAERSALEEATLALAQRATLLGDAKTASVLLAGLRPAAENRARYWLWRAAVARLEGDRARLARALESAARNSRSEVFRRRLRTSTEVH